MNEDEGGLREAPLVSENWSGRDAVLGAKKSRRSGIPR